MGSSSTAEEPSSWDASMIAATCDDARSRSSFTTVWSNHVRWSNSQPAVWSRRAIRSSDSVPRPRSRRSSSSGDGGSRKIRIASGTSARICSRSFDVDLEQHVVPGPPLLLDPAPGRARSMTDDVGPLQQLAVPDHAIELVVVHEEIVNLVDFLGTRRTGRDADGQHQPLRDPGQDLANDRSLADAGWPRDDEERARCGATSRTWRSAAPAAWHRDHERDGWR